MSDIVPTVDVWCEEHGCQWHLYKSRYVSQTAAARIEQLEAALRDARGALATIHNNTEPDAIKHRDYEHLAASIYNCAKDALDGNFVDDMHAAEVYDKLYPRATHD